MDDRQNPGGQPPYPGQQLYQGQPPYPAQQSYPGQQPYPGRPPYQGQSYPGPPYPSPPPRRGRGGLIALAVAGAVVLVAGLGLIVVQLTGGSDDSAGGPTSPSAWTPSSTTSSSGQASPSSTVEDCLGCFPGVKLTAVMAQAKAKGYKCATDGADRYKCTKSKVTGRSEYELSLHSALRDDTVVGNFSFATYSTGDGSFPQGGPQSLAKLRADLPFVLAAMFPDEQVRTQVNAWVQQNLTVCPAPTTISGYEVSCSKPTQLSLTIGNKSATSWSADVSIFGRE
ncbi:hypothetical protein AB0I34_14620 [Kribbella sp. NPDC050281]|uniref:hypothetical protein n=1 Tax=Kribbella sp. NPDC050281 TaxID=3155515 RepID=UPI0033FDD18D